MKKIPTAISLSLFSTIVIYSLVFVLTQNISFWKVFWSLQNTHSADSYIFALSVSLVLMAGTIVLLTLLLWSRLRLPVLAILLILSTVFNYYSYHYHIYMDRDMIINIFETNTLEAYDLISIKLFMWLFIGAIIPFILLTRIRVNHTKWWKLGLQRIALIVVSIAVIGTTASVYYKDYASFFRNNRQIVKLIMPSSYISSYVSYARKNYAQNMPFTTIGDDAVLIKPVTKDQKKTLFVMVVGETARRHNFSLNGYGQETNPLLSKQNGLVSFQRMRSCGTATAVSVPCMFSYLTHDNFDKITAENQENVLDVAQKSGYKVLWRENDHGCKGVCERIPTEVIEDTIGEGENSGSFSYDELLLKDLDKYVDANKDNDENLMIVLHMNGSHGPTYYQRYPDAFKRFLPSCETSKIETCSQEMLVNTYDNTILYTDYVLNETIELLKQYSDDYEVAMLYVSDHGESLGESGFYLHGTPYAIAPKEQTEIPLIFWGEEQFINNHQIDPICLRDKAQHDDYSHDNIFHTLLGILQIQTMIYEPNLNIFKECQN